MMSSVDMVRTIRQMFFDFSMSTLDLNLADFESWFKHVLRFQRNPHSSISILDGVSLMRSLTIVLYATSSWIIFVFFSTNLSRGKFLSPREDYCSLHLHHPCAIYSPPTQKLSHDHLCSFWGKRPMALLRVVTVHLYDNHVVLVFVKVKLKVCPIYHNFCGQETSLDIVFINPSYR